MTIYQWLGVAIFAALFLAGIAFMIHDLGWREAVTGLGFIFSLVSIVLLASLLLAGVIP